MVIGHAHTLAEAHHNVLHSPSITSRVDHSAKCKCGGRADCTLSTAGEQKYESRPGCGETQIFSQVSCHENSIVNRVDIYIN